MLDENLRPIYEIIMVYNQRILSMRPFGEAQSKAKRGYTQSLQYTIVESRVRLTINTLIIFFFFLVGRYVWWR